MDWVTELERLWVALDGVMGRAMFALKIKEDAHPVLKEKLAEKGEEFTEEELIAQMQRFDVIRAKKSKGPVREERVGGAEKGGFDRLPKEQWEKLKERAEASVRKQLQRDGQAPGAPVAPAPAKPATPPARGGSDPGGRKPNESEDEYRFRLGLCLKCGEKGHRRIDCPAKAKVSAVDGRERKRKEGGMDGEEVEGIAVPEIRPTARYVPGGRSYADAATAWKNGRVLAKKDRAVREAPTQRKATLQGDTTRVRFDDAPPSGDADTHIAGGSATVENANTTIDDMDKT